MPKNRNPRPLLVEESDSGASTEKPDRSLETASGKNTTEALSDEERASFQKHENVIRRFAELFIPAGEALRDIRDKKLYRESSPTWADYCESRLGMGKTQANRLIACATMAEKMTPIGVRVLPKCESQMRELLPLKDPKVVTEVWLDQIEQHGGTDITAAKLRKVVRERLARPDDSPDKPLADATASSSAEVKARLQEPSTAEDESATEEEAAAETDAEAEATADTSTDPGADAGAVPGNGSLGVDVESTGGNPETEVESEASGGRTFRLADGAEKVIPNWVEGAIDCRSVDKGLEALAERRQKGEAAMPQTIFLEFAAAANRLTKGLPEKEAKPWVKAAGRMIWEIIG